MKLSDWLKENNDKYTILQLDSEKLSDLIDFLPKQFKKFYISEEEINESLRKGVPEKIDKKIILSSCIPDKGNVMAGDFGEITGYILLQERYHPVLLEGPFKWRWKEDKNKPMGKTDVLLYNCNENPSPDDLLVTAETKLKATKKSTYDPIKNASEGAKLDSTSRMAKTLSWLNDKALRSGDYQASKKLERFLFSIEEGFGPYQKNCKAVIFIEESLLEEELQRERLLPELENFEIIIVSISGLKDLYQKVYKEILNNA